MLFQGKYQHIIFVVLNLAWAEFIHIKCVAGEKQAHRRFLLDNGRLQLEPVKLAFSLTTVELILGNFVSVCGCLSVCENKKKREMDRVIFRHNSFHIHACVFLTSFTILNLL